jgi:hypothetical protein
MCYGQPGCKDTHCPGHPGHPGVTARAMPPKVDLSRVQLIGQPDSSRRKRHGLAALAALVVKRLAVGVVLCALVLLALNIDNTDTTPRQTTTWKEAA